MPSAEETDRGEANEVSALAEPIPRARKSVTMFPGFREAGHPAECRDGWLTGVGHKRLILWNKQWEGPADCVRTLAALASGMHSASS